MTVFWNQSFYFYLNVYKLNDRVIFIWKKDSMPHFSVSMLYFCRLNPLAWIANLFAGSMGFWVMSSGDKPIRTLKISVTNVCRFQYFAHFNIKFVLLRKNSFEWIAFCSVEYCVFLIYTETLKSCHCRLFLIISVLFNWTSCKVLDKRYKMSRL